MKCIDCEAPIKEVKDTEKGERYLCENLHLRERMVDHESVTSFEEDGRITHKSVGAVIRAEGDILLLKRRKFPYKYSIPAGHMEDGEESLESAVREIQEETGIEVEEDDLKLAYTGTLYDECRRGANYHRWNLYFVELDKKPEVEGNDEAEHLMWVNNPLDNKVTDVTEKLLTHRVVEKLLQIRSRV